MLDVLRLGDESGIEDLRIRILLDQLAALLDEGFHADAFLSTGADAELLANLLQPGGVLRRLLQVRAKCLS